MTIIKGEPTKVDNRQKILNAALNLFTTTGFHATPISAIYKEAGVSSGTLFHYFPDKNSLIGELYLSIKTEMSKVFSEADKKDLPIKDRIENILWAYMIWGIENHEKQQFMIQFHNSPNIAEGFKKEAHLRFAWTKEVITQGIESGLFKDVSVDIIQINLYLCGVGLIQLVHEKKSDLSIEKAFNDYTEIFWNGVLR